jgi:hypothetical protein
MSTTDMETPAGYVLISRVDLDALVDTKVRAALEDAKISEKIQDESRAVLALVDEKNDRHGNDLMLRAEVLAVGLHEGSERRMAPPINAKFEEFDAKLQRLRDEHDAGIRARSALAKENADLRQEIQDLRNLTNRRLDRLKAAADLEWSYEEQDPRTRDIRHHVDNPMARGISLPPGVPVFHRPRSP